MNSAMIVGQDEWLSGVRAQEYCLPKVFSAASEGRVFVMAFSIGAKRIYATIDRNRFRELGVFVKDIKNYKGGEN